MNDRRLPLNETSRVSYLPRLLDVMEHVVAAPGPVALSSLASATGIPLSTASRLSALLASRGYLYRRESGSFVAGPLLAQLGLRAISRLHDATQLEIATSELCRKVAESVSAGLLIGDEIVLVARTEPDYPLRVVARVGDVVAPHTSAMGKVILAHLAPRQRVEVLSRHCGDEQAEVLLQELEPELAEVRETGFACDEQTYAVGQRCRAVALFRADRAFGALSVAGPAARFSVDAAVVATGLLRTKADELSMEYRNQPEQEAVSGRE